MTRTGRKTWSMRRGISQNRVYVAAAALAGAGVLGWFVLSVTASAFARARAATYQPGFDLLPSGKEVVFSGAGEGGRDLYRLDLESLRVTSLGATPELETDPAAGPRGEVLFTGVELGGVERTRIYLRTADGRARPITNPGNGTDYGARFLPDGRSLVFVRAHAFNPLGLGRVWLENDLYRMDLNGEGLTRLTREKYYGLDGVSVSPDGRTVVYSASGAYPDTKPHLFQLDLEKGGPPKQHTRGSWDDDPAFAPDGRTVAFVSDYSAAYNYDLHAYSLDAGAIRRLTRAPQKSFSRPRYTSDGSHLLVLSQPTATEIELWQVEVRGTRVQQLADESLFNRPLEWKGTPNAKR